MNQDALLLALALAGLALLAMAGLHERHYRGRGRTIHGARLAATLTSLDTRLDAVERILLEDRQT